MSSTSAVRRSQRNLLLAQVGRLALFLLLTRYLATMLAPADFGFFALVSTLFAVAADLLDAGTTAAATRRIAQDASAERTLLGILLGWRRLLALILAVICCGLAVSGVVATGLQRIALMAVAVGLYLLHLSAYQVVFPVRQAFGKPLLLGLGLQSLFLFCCFGVLRLAANGLVPLLIPLLVVAREIAQVVGSRLLAVRLIGTRLQAPPRLQGLHLLWRESWKFGICTLLYKLAFHAGSFCVWLLAGPETMGSYSASLRLFAPVADVAWVFVTPLIASMSVAVGTDDVSFRRQLDASMNFHVGAAALFAVYGLLLAPALLNALYGARYASGPLSTVAAFRWLCGAFSCAMLTPALAVAMLAQRRESDLLVVCLIGFGINLAINFWAVPYYGAQGAAAACFVTEVLLLSGLAIRLGFSGTWKPGAGMLPYLIPSALMGCILSALAAYPRLALGLAVAISPIMLVMMYLLKDKAQPAITGVSAAVTRENKT